MTLKTLLQQEKNIRRLFGQKEIEIMQKQLAGMSLTQSQKNRLSRDIRPKLACIKELAKVQDEFALKKNQDNKALMQKTVKVMLQDELQKNIKAILLFGSFADKSFTPRSDIDICAVFKNNVSLKEATKFRIRISGQLPEKVDIQVFNVLPQKIKRAIARNHKVLYQKQEHDDLVFSIQYVKDEDYFIRVKKIFGATT